ncbi:hypothetical protein BH23PLA1_BH23PLA1_04940 [soil metagenome]
MRYVWMALLIVILAAFAAFAVYNLQPMEVRFPFIETRLSAPAFLVMLVIYFLGMISGWSVLAFLRRSIHAASDRHDKSGL